MARFGRTKGCVARCVPPIYRPNHSLTTLIPPPFPSRSRSAPGMALAAQQTPHRLTPGSLVCHVTTPWDPCSPTHPPPSTPNANGSDPTTATSPSEYEHERQANHPQPLSRCLRCACHFSTLRVPPLHIACATSPRQTWAQIGERL